MDRRNQGHAVAQAPAGLLSSLEVTRKLRCIAFSARGTDVAGHLASANQTDASQQIKTKGVSFVRGEMVSWKIKRHIHQRIWE